MWEMYHSDGKIRQAIDLPVRMALNNWKSYRHINPAITEFVLDYIMRRIRIKEIVKSILSARVYGVSVSVVCPEIIDNFLVTKDIVTVPPQAYLKAQSIGLKKVVLTDKQGNEKSFPRDQVIVYTWGATFREAYGVPMLNYVKALWDKKSEILDAWRLFLRKFGIPFVIGWVEPGLENPDRENFLTKLKELTYAGVTVLSREADGKKPDKEVEFKEVAKSAGDFEKFYQVVDRDIYIALGIPESTFNANTGTYSLGESQAQTLMKTVHEIEDAISDIVNHRILSPLLLSNFNEVRPGKLIFQDLSGDKLLAETGAIKNLTDCGYLTPETDGEAVCDRAGLGNGIGAKTPAVTKTTTPAKPNKGGENGATNKPTDKPSPK